MLLPPNSSDAFQVEREFLKSLKFFELDAFDKFQLYAFRRPLLVFPQNMKFEFDTENNIILEFSLPTGSYATVLLGTVFKNIDKVTYEGNSFHIPG
jgi:tRNA(Glu) U13 pseudouridine synthase TruD